MAKKIDLWEDYRKFLVRMIKRRGYDHEKLMRALHDIDFRWSMELDKNRAYDGEDLRLLYFKEKGILSIDFGRPCSVLEMLVGMAKRIDGDWVGDWTDPHPEVIFWDMLKNLGLDQMTDTRFDAEKVERSIKIWLDREYDYDGNGSIFPVRGATRDHRKVEIWMQMTEYVSRYY